MDMDPQMRLRNAPALAVRWGIDRIGPEGVKLRKYVLEGKVNPDRYDNDSMHGSFGGI
jgi:hypothetical protein